MFEKLSRPLKCHTNNFFWSHTYIYKYINIYTRNTDHKTPARACAYKVITIHLSFDFLGALNMHLIRTIQPPPPLSLPTLTLLDFLLLLIWLDPFPDMSMYTFVGVSLEMTLNAWFYKLTHESAH